jgi:selenium metabolism protein YedF
MEELGLTVGEPQGGFMLNIVKESVQVQKDEMPGTTVILIKSSILGEGDDVLGSVLIKSFIYTLTQLEGELQGLLFMNSGVLLTTSGSELTQLLKKMERSGVEVISCSTCLEYYRLQDKLEVGRSGSMYSITAAMMRAGKVIVL